MPLVAPLITIGPTGLGLLQRALDAQRQRVLLTDVTPIGIDQRQPVGIGVLAKPDRTTMLADHLGDLGQIIGGRFGNMRELRPSGVSPTATTWQPSASSNRLPSSLPAP